MISAWARGQEVWKVFIEKQLGFYCLCCWNACKHNVFGTILDDFGMDARVMTLWYFLQGIIEICLCWNKKWHFILFFDRESGLQQNNRIRIPSFCEGVAEENYENMAAA